MPEVRLPQGTIRYEDRGTGAPIVLIHGVLVDGRLWRDVMPRLAQDFRVIVPDLPLGSHRVSLEHGTDLSPVGLAQIIADFLDALDLEEVTLVGNDTGGALCQLVAVSRPERLARLVLTPCDAFENFPPPMFKPLQLMARIPGAVFLLGQAMRSRLLRKSPGAYGLVSKRAGDELTRAWIEPLLENAAIRSELTAVLKGMNKRHTLEAAKSFPRFQLPVLVVWADRDRFFPRRFAERLAAAFPNARLERIEDSYAFTPIDQPERTAALISEFARVPLSATAD